MHRRTAVEVVVQEGTGTHSESLQIPATQNYLMLNPPYKPLTTTELLDLYFAPLISHARKEGNRLEPLWFYRLQALEEQGVIHQLNEFNNEYIESQCKEQNHSHSNLSDIEFLLVCICKILNENEIYNFEKLSPADRHKLIEMATKSRTTIGEHALSLLISFFIRSSCKEIVEYAILLLNKNSLRLVKPNSENDPLYPSSNVACDNSFYIDHGNRFGDLCCSKYVDLSHANLTLSEKLGCEIKIDFTAQYLRGCRGSKLAYSQVKFQYSCLEEGDLSYANLPDASFEYSDAFRIKLIGIKAPRSKFRFANLAFAEFGIQEDNIPDDERADLSNAKFEEANLSFARIIAVKAAEAYFKNTCIYRTYFYDCCFIKAQFLDLRHFEASQFDENKKLVFNKKDDISSNAQFSCHSLNYFSRQQLSQDNRTRLERQNVKFIYISPESQIGETGQDIDFKNFLYLTQSDTEPSEPSKIWPKWSSASLNGWVPHGLHPKTFTIQIDLKNKQHLTSSSQANFLHLLAHYLIYTTSDYQSYTTYLEDARLLRADSIKKFLDELVVKHEGEKGAITVNRIQINFNRDLWEYYQRTKKKFKDRGRISNHEVITWHNKGRQFQELPFLDKSIAECWLYHGTEDKNLVNISAVGLTSHFKVLHSSRGFGAMGKGIYLTDNFAKCATYISCLRCHNKHCECEGSDERTVILARTLLGQIGVVKDQDSFRFQAKLPESVDSYYGPAKELKADGAFGCNEFMVRDRREEAGIFPNYNEVQVYPEFYIYYTNNNKNKGKSKNQDVHSLDKHLPNLTVTSRIFPDLIQEIILYYRVAESRPFLQAYYTLLELIVLINEKLDHQNSKLCLNELILVKEYLTKKTTEAQLQLNSRPLRARHESFSEMIPFHYHLQLQHLSMNDQEKVPETYRGFLLGLQEELIKRFEHISYEHSLYLRIIGNFLTTTPSGSIIIPAINKLRWLKNVKANAFLYLLQKIISQDHYLGFSYTLLSTNFSYENEEQKNEWINYVIRLQWQSFIISTLTFTQCKELFSQFSQNYWKIEKQGDREKIRLGIYQLAKESTHHAKNYPDERIAWLQEEIANLPNEVGLRERTKDEYTTWNQQLERDHFQDKETDVGVKWVIPTWNEKDKACNFKIGEKKFLRSELIAQIFETDQTVPEKYGTLKVEKKQQNGRSLVILLEDKGAPLTFIKCYPRMPMRQFLMDSLCRRLSGYSVVTTLANFYFKSNPGYPFGRPVLISRPCMFKLRPEDTNYQPATLLNHLDALEDEFQNTLDNDAYFWKFIETLILAPRDDKTDNLARQKIIGSQEFRPITIDPEEGFENELATPEGPLLFSVLLLFKQAFKKESWSKTVTDHYLKLNLLQLLKDWLMEVKRYSTCLKTLFSKEELQEYERLSKTGTETRSNGISYNVSFYIDRVFRIDDVGMLFQRMQQVRNGLLELSQSPKKEQKRPIDLLNYLSNWLAYFYKQAYRSIPPNGIPPHFKAIPSLRFQLLCGVEKNFEIKKELSSYEAKHVEIKKEPVTSPASSAAAQAVQEGPSTDSQPVQKSDEKISSTLDSTHSSLISREYPQSKMPSEAVPAGFFASLATFARSEEKNSIRPLNPVNCDNVILDCFNLSHDRFVKILGCVKNGQLTPFRESTTSNHLRERVLRALPSWSEWEKDNTAEELISAIIEAKLKKVCVAKWKETLNKTNRLTDLFALNSITELRADFASSRNDLDLLNSIAKNKSIIKLTIVNFDFYHPIMKVSPIPTYDFLYIKKLVLKNSGGNYFPLLAPCLESLIIHGERNEKKVEEVDLYRHKDGNALNFSVSQLEDVRKAEDGKICERVKNGEWKIIDAIISSTRLANVLQRLMVSFTHSPHSQQKLLENLTRVTNLSIINLSGFIKLEEKQLIELLKSSSGLKHLSLADCTQLNDSLVKHLNDNCQDIEVLNLSRLPIRRLEGNQHGIPFTKKWLHSLILNNCKDLRTLNVSAPVREMDLKGVSNLAHLHVNSEQLIELNVADSNNMETIYLLAENLTALLIGSSTSRQIRITGYCPRLEVIKELSRFTGFATTSSDNEIRDRGEFMIKSLRSLALPSNALYVYDRNKYEIINQNPNNLIYIRFLFENLSGWINPRRYYSSKVPEDNDKFVLTDYLYILEMLGRKVAFKHLLALVRARKIEPIDKMLSFENFATNIEARYEKNHSIQSFLDAVISPVIDCLLFRLTASDQQAAQHINYFGTNLIATRLKVLFGSTVFMPRNSQRKIDEVFNYILKRLEPSNEEKCISAARLFVVLYRFHSAQSYETVIERLIATLKNSSNLVHLRWVYYILFIFAQDAALAKIISRALIFNDKFIYGESASSPFLQHPITCLLVQLEDYKDSKKFGELLLASLKEHDNPAIVMLTLQALSKLSQRDRSLDRTELQALIRSKIPTIIFLDKPISTIDLLTAMQATINAFEPHLMDSSVSDCLFEMSLTKDWANFFVQSINDHRIIYDTPEPIQQLLYNLSLIASSHRDAKISKLKEMQSSFKNFHFHHQACLRFIQMTLPSFTINDDKLFHISFFIVLRLHQFLMYNLEPIILFDNTISPSSSLLEQHGMFKRIPLSESEKSDEQAIFDQHRRLSSAAKNNDELLLSLIQMAPK